jgi:Zn-dependent peptidase ImmA (M78 family)/transcriptional regulator with XRE-family HTH domain
MARDETVGRRLAAARARAGLSLRGLAGAIGSLVSAQAIGKYERSEMQPSRPVMRALGRALRVPESYLRGDSVLRLESVEFRKNRLTTRREEAAIKSRVLVAVERYLEIEQLVGVASGRSAPRASLPILVHSLPEAETAAARLRAFWRLGAGPLPDIAEVLEEHGVRVVAIALPPSVSGLACLARRSRGAPVPVIAINEADTGERQRLTLAHELGHLVLRIAGDDLAEKTAFRFGAALLMPAEILWAEVGRKRRTISLAELLELKRMFGTSAQAIAYRLRDLGITGESTYRQMFDRFERLGWLRPPYPEPHPMPRVEPQRFRRLCFRAVAEGIVSETAAATLLDMGVARLRRELREPPSRR